MRVLVCGGRTSAERSVVFRTLDSYRLRYGSLTIIQGGAHGADALARVGATAPPRVRFINEPVTSSDWKLFGKAAGPLRTPRRIDLHPPHFVIAFPGGRGTADRVCRAKAAKIDVVEIT